MQTDKSLSEQQSKQFTDFSNVDNTPGAPMKFDGKEVRGVNVEVVKAPTSSKGNLVAPIVIVGVLIAIIVVIVFIMFNGSSSSEESSGSASSTSSSASSTSSGAAASSEGISIKFKKPDKWGDTINVYVYSDSDKLSKWPGDAMKKESDGLYSFTIPADMAAKKPLVIFNDGKTQFPVRDAAGLDAVNGKTYDIDKEETSK